MSRREDRSSEARRRHSRFDREPSPKRSRRDGRAQSERLLTEPEPDRDRFGRDHKANRRLRDPLPLESPLRHDPKGESGMRSKESENRGDVHHGGTKQSTDPYKGPRSRSYFEHDDRAGVGKNGRGFSRRTDKERGWWNDPKEAIDKPTKDDKPKNSSRDNNCTWRHDGYFETEANPKPPTRKRPAFREQKISADEKTDKPAADPGFLNPQDHRETGKRDERGHTSRHSDKPEKRDLNRGPDWRGNFSSRDRSDPSGRYNRSSDRFNTRQGVYRPSVGGRVEKWKHDLYDEANKSLSPKNDEDQVSKIEALLAS